MHTSLRQVLRLLVGSEIQLLNANVSFADQAPCGSFVLASRSSRRARHALKDRGYTYLHSFLTLPSKNTPRWLLPAGDRERMIAGTSIYEPHRWITRVAKKTLVGMIRAGWSGQCFSKVLLASKQKFELENLVSGITGEPHPVFAMSFGRQAAVRKLTVQVMRPNGEVIGYIKLPLTDAALERVRNEANIVERLWAFGALRQHIPRLLFGGSWNNTHIVFQSHLSGDRGPLTFSNAHEAFLYRLWNAHAVEIPGERVIEGVAAKWRKIYRNLNNEWEDIGDEALRRSTSDLQDKVLRCGVTHGDFAPWNTRVHQDDLLLFDWESALWEAPNSWDVFHFHVRTYFLNRYKRLDILKREPSDESSFMLYCLHSVCQLWEENNHKGIGLYKELLMRAFQRRSERTAKLDSIV